MTTFPVHVTIKIQKGKGNPTNQKGNFKMVATFSKVEVMTDKNNKPLSKNGVELRRVLQAATSVVMCYELYMDGEFLSRFKVEREARAMWKDFAGC